MLTEQQLIDKYIRNELSEEETQLFELKIQNPEFNKLVAEHELLKSALGEVEAGNLKQMLKNHESQNAPKPSITSKFGWKLMVTALLLILSIVAYRMLSQSTIDNNSIYAQFYSPYPNVIDPITKGDKVQLTLFQLYEMKKYKEVIFMLKNQGTQSPDQTFYLASSYMAINQFDEADALFAKVSTSPKYADASHWFRSLICLQNENRNCRKLFQDIVDQKNSFYHQKASQIVKSIK